SIKVSSVTAPHAPWAFDAAVRDVVAHLTPLLRRAAQASPAKFVNLDMEEYHDLDLTVAVFTGLLDLPEFFDLEAGIVLQAYLPDALGAMIRLQEWAADRRARGGAPVKVRVVKGANLPMEQVDATLHGWPLATWSSKQESDTNYKRVLRYALTPEHIDNVRVGVAGHNLFDVAYAWLLAGRLGTRAGVEFEMLIGMAPAQAQAVRADVGELLLYTPAVHPREFDVAISYLIRRLEEGASSENFMSAVFQLADNQQLFAREERRFRDSLAALDDAVPEPRRRQDRRHEDPLDVSGPFANEPDTDPSLAANREWAATIIARAASSEVGADLVASARIQDAGTLEAVLGEAADGGRAWGARPAPERADVVARCAAALAAARAELMEVMAAEAGKTLDQSDGEVSEAIDFARYYAERARELDQVDGARAVPVPLTLVTPPWNFPVAIPAGSTLAALASGSGVVIKPAPQAERCAARMVQALWDAGVPRSALHLVTVAEDELGRTLVTDPRVDRVILTGGYPTAELFRSWRPDLPLFAETSGKNAIVVTPGADLDLAVKDVVASAFGHAGQKCSAASLVILVGSAARSERFRHQLVDAVASLAVGWPTDPTSQMGPLIEPPSDTLRAGLTELGEGERWLVQPHPLDDSGRLWRPGVRDGVRPGSAFHRTEYFGPVLGLMTVASLEDALTAQNGVDFGLTAGLHSLDAAEVATWVDGVEAGNVYVNRGVTGAIVRRQPFGGWKRSAVGTGTKAGGPSYLLGLSDWVPAPAAATAEPCPAVRALLDGVRATLEPDMAGLERAARSDAAAWRDHLGVPSDESGLWAERNVLRHLPVPTLVRLSAGGSVAELVRVVAAAITAGAVGQVSTATELPGAVAAALRAAGFTLAVHDDGAFARSLAAGGPARVRVIGAAPGALGTALGGRPDVTVHDRAVTEAGRLEVLVFLREQAVSVTAHRFGTPNPLAWQVLATDR
ncbi:MAG: proline dehydrogenase family protein, partial [Cellulomonadaceae bacterium]